MTLALRCLRLILVNRKKCKFSWASVRFRPCAAHLCSAQGVRLTEVLLTCRSLDRHSRPCPDSDIDHAAIFATALAIGVHWAAILTAPSYAQASSYRRLSIRQARAKLINSLVAPNPTATKKPVVIPASKSNGMNIARKYRKSSPPCGGSCTNSKPTVATAATPPMQAATAAANLCRCASGWPTIRYPSMRTMVASTNCEVWTLKNTQSGP